jgi:hypothetical protein
MHGSSLEVQLAQPLRHYMAPPADCITGNLPVELGTCMLKQLLKRLQPTRRTE